MNRRFKAEIDKNKTATTINSTVAEFVVKGPAPVNDIITVPLEVKGRKLDICCVVVAQHQKIILGKQCLEAFGLLVGIVQKPSVHMRLGNKVAKTNHRNNSNQNYRNHNNNRSNNNRSNHNRNNNSSRNRDNDRRPHQRVYQTWSSRPDEMKAIMYPGCDQSGDNASEDVIELHPSNEDLMRFD